MVVAFMHIGYCVLNRMQVGAPLSHKAQVGTGSLVKEPWWLQSLPRWSQKPSQRYQSSQQGRFVWFWNYPPHGSFLVVSATDGLRTYLYKESTVEFNHCALFVFCGDCWRPPIALCFLKLRSSPAKIVSILRIFAANLKISHPHQL